MCECDLSFNIVDIINTIMKEPKKKINRPIKIKSKEELRAREKSRQCMAQA